MKLLIIKTLKKFHIFYFLLYNDSGGVDMENQIKILNLLNQKRQYVTLLNELVYGAIEIREKDSKKYIYLHTKEDGLQSTKYVGEYTEELYNLVLNNNIKAKTLKKSIRNIEKELNKLERITSCAHFEHMRRVDVSCRSPCMAFQPPFGDVFRLSLAGSSPGIPCRRSFGFQGAVHR